MNHYMSNEVHLLKLKKVKHVSTFQLSEKSLKGQNLETRD